MTELLQQVIAQIEKLPPNKQDESLSQEARSLVLNFFIHKNNVD